MSTHCSTNFELSALPGSWSIPPQLDSRVNSSKRLSIWHLFPLRLCAIFTEVPPLGKPDYLLNQAFSKCLHELPTRDQRGPQWPFHTSLPSRLSTRELQQLRGSHLHTLRYPKRHPRLHCEYRYVPSSRMHRGLRHLIESS